MALIFTSVVSLLLYSSRNPKKPKRSSETKTFFFEKSAAKFAIPLDFIAIKCYNNRIC